MMYLISKTFLLRELEAQQAPRQAPPQGTMKEPEGDASAPPDALLQAKDEMIGTLQGIIETKDKQMDNLSKKIDELIERDRETNFLLKGLQDRIFLLEGSQRATPSEAKKEEPVKTEKQRK